LLDALQHVREALHLLPHRRLITSWSSADDPRIDRLWARSNKGQGLVSIRDTEFLRWRFESSPKPARLLFICDARNDELLTWFACEGDGPVLHVRDFWSEDAERGIPRAHVSQLLQVAYAAGYTSVSYEFCGPANAHAALQAAGFRERGRRPVYGRL